MLFLNTSLSLTSFKLNRYNPYINYSWSQTLTVGGNQQIKDTGTSGLSLQQFFGQGCWFNGIDQAVSTDVKLSGTSWSFALRYKADSNLAESALSQFIPGNTGRIRLKTQQDGNFNVQFGSYSINALLDTTTKSRDIYVSYTGTILSLYADGVFISNVDTINPLIPANTNIEIGKTNPTYFNGTVKDVYAFNRQLTPTEIEKYTNNPNQFFMDSLGDNSCILAMPMCEKDNYVRNYKSYSYSNFLMNSIGLKSTIISNTRIAQLDAGLLVKAGKTYLIKYSFIDNDNIKGFKGYIPPPSNGGTAINLDFTRTNTNNEFIVTIPTTYTGNDGGSFYCWLAVNETNISVNFDEASIREINGIYPITNYLATCRNAQRLSYGLQTSGFKRDNNGLILSKSNSLEADGVGYGNTGWGSIASEEKTIEYIVEKLLRIPTVFESIVTDGKAESNLYSRFNINKTNSIGTNIGGNGYTEVTFNNVVHITIVLKTNGYELFKDGVSQGFKNATGSIPRLTDVLIGTDANRIKTLSSPIRLLKVHSKALTQAEITKNYNSYVAKGLLNE